jgi:DNA-binding LacI/PurR family transcriptional regulator
MVADRVNLSLATVSLALRGAPTIPKETRERVLAAARELNYTHARRTSVPSTAQQRQIVFVMADSGNIPVTANPFFGEVLHGVEAACRMLDLNLIFRTLPYPTQSTDDLIHSLQNLAFAGLLLAGPFQPPVVKQIADIVAGPLILIDNAIPAIPYDTIVTDDVGGGYQATKHLIGLGHRRISIIVGETERPSYMERFRGYRLACEEAGIVPEPPILCGFNRADAFAAFAQILAQPVVPTAVFCVNDNYAMYGIEALRERGYAVPHDMSVVGFDNLAYAAMSSVPLTTVSILPRILGQVGVQRMVARLDGDQMPFQSIALRTELIVRASTAAPRGVTG